LAFATEGQKGASNTLRRCGAKEGTTKLILLPFESDLNSTWRLDSEGSQEVVRMYSTMRILGNLHVVEG